MRCRLITLVLLFSGIIGQGYAQKDTSAKKDTAGSKDGIILPGVVENGDTIAIYNMGDIKIETQIDPEMQKKQDAWARLYRNVPFLMNYAKACANKMSEIDKQMAALDKKSERHKYLKAQREQLVKDYATKLKDLSDYQGALLIKLIYRQTGKTTYDLIKEYESGFTAGFWQTLGRLDGLNLKDTYDPVKDASIEKAIKMQGL